MSFTPKPTSRQRSNRSRSSSQEEIWVFENWGVEFGKMEACLARRDTSLATPEKAAGK